MLEETQLLSLWFEDHTEEDANRMKGELDKIVESDLEPIAKRELIENFSRVIEEYNMESKAIKKEGE